MDNTLSSPVTENKVSTRLMGKIDLGLVKNISILVALLLLAIFGLPRLIVQPAHISVAGNGSLSVPPKQVSLIVTRTDKSTDLAVAIRNGEDGVSTLISAVKATMGSGAVVQKSSYTTSIVNSQQMSNGVLVNVNMYQVVSGFKVTFNLVGKFDDLIRVLYANGASSVTNIAFIPDDKDAVEQNVRKLAIDDAKAQAIKVAASMGKRLGKVVSLVDNPGDISSALSAGQGDLGIGNIDITRSVSVVYEVW